MQVAMWVTWSRPVAGREKRALEYGVEVQDHWGKLAAEGKCTSPEMFIARSGGGMWMVKGERNMLTELVETEASQRLLAIGMLVLEGFGYEFLDTADSADAYLGRFGAVGAELGYI